MDSQSSTDTIYVHTPPALPAHLASIYDLKPITGQPTNDEVKIIHAAIRAVSAEAQIPQLCNPELLLQLSQHLFSVQMAVYRSAYPLSILPKDNTYAPPSLPTHIPITLKPVTGSPSNEQLKTAQDAMRIVESRGFGPLFDPDLNMHLSQHLFNLQLARYIQDSTLGRFTAKSNAPRHLSPSTPRSDGVSLAGSGIGSGEAGSPLPPHTIDTGPEAHITQLELARNAVPVPNITQPLGSEPATGSNYTSSDITQLGQAVNNIKELMSESKGVLENINRVLIATQRNQVVAGNYNSNIYVHRNLVNDQGVTAVESGLPQLRYSYYRSSYGINGFLNSAQLAGYLRFFDIGADLIEGIEGEDAPRLRDGVESQAERLILKHLGLVY
ncbi:hypothetical protein ACGC1H_007370 [Rhizoctonia solani]